MIKNIFQYSEIRAHRFSGQAQSCSNILNKKVYSSENFQSKLCFSGQAKVAQKA